MKPLFYGIGGKRSLQSYKKQPVPNLHRSDEQAAMHQSKPFVAACHSTKDVQCEKQLSINRELLWNMKAKKGGKPSLKSIPPTDEALDLNILRARYQSIQWHNSLYQDFVPPIACQNGWSKNITSLNYAATRNNDCTRGGHDLNKRCMQIKQLQYKHVWL